MPELDRNRQRCEGRDCWLRSALTGIVGLIKFASMRPTWPNGCLRITSCSQCYCVKALLKSVISCQLKTWFSQWIITHQSLGETLPGGTIPGSLTIANRQRYFPGAVQVVGVRAWEPWAQDHSTHAGQRPSTGGCQTEDNRSLLAFCVQQENPNLTQLIGPHRERESPQGAV